MIFEVTADDIAALGDDPLRRLVALLAEQELVRRDLSPSAVLSGGDQNAKDGGIDVRVELGEGTSVDGFVPRSETGFQAKATDMPASKIEEEMSPKGKLLDSIADLAARDGAYIIVSSHGSTADTALKNRREAMQSCIDNAGLTGRLHIDFYDRQRLATWVNQHPGLINWVKHTIGRPFLGWRPYSDWSSKPSDAEYVLDDEVRLHFGKSSEPDGVSASDGIERLRDTLRQPKSVVRLVGLSGVGKTKLIHALFDERVGANALQSSRAIYTDVGENPDPVPLEMLHRIHETGQGCVLIVDNCGSELHGKLAAFIKHNNTRASLITVEYDISDDVPENTDVVRMEPSSEETLKKVVGSHFPALTSPELDCVVEFAAGNARVALALADTAESGESLANFKDETLFKRLFKQRKPDAPGLLQAAEACSLVYSFDVEQMDGDGAELPVLAELARMPTLDLYAQVAELEYRHLAQRRGNWRAVLPHAISHRLAKHALQRMPLTHVTDVLLRKGTPERLIKSFSKRLGDLHEVEAVRALVRSWLSDGGWLNPVENLNDLGRTCFGNIAAVDLDATLTALEQAAERGKLVQNQYSIAPLRSAELLRSIAYEPQFFTRAALLLSNMAREKTESNNAGDAVNVFRSLFFIVLSGTHASVEQRLDVLRTLVASGNDHDAELLYSALQAMLETGHFSSSYTHQFGSRRRDFGFHPRTQDDVERWYGSVLDFCVELEGQSDFHSARVRDLLVSKIPYFSSHIRDAKKLFSTIEKIRDRKPWPELWAAARKARRFAEEKSESAKVEAFTKLADQLRPTSLPERIAVYATAALWGDRDLAEIDEPTDDSSTYKAAYEAIDAECQAIGQELASTPDLFIEHIDLLKASDQNRIGQVGRGVAIATSTPEEHWNFIREKVIDKADTGHADFVNLALGYVGGLKERAPSLIDGILDDVMSDPALRRYVVSFHSRVGIDEKGLARLIEATRSGDVPVERFKSLAWGRTNNALSSEQFHALWTAVYTMDDSHDTALELLYMRCHSMTRDGEAGLNDGEIRCAETLIEGLDQFVRNDREGHRIAEIIKACIDPDKHEELARKSLRKLRDQLSRHEVSSYDCAQFIAALSEKFPRVVLEELLESTNEEDDLDEHMVFVATRPAGSLVAPFWGVPKDTLFGWVDEAPQERVAVAASMIRAWTSEGDKSQDSEPELVWTDTAMDLLERSDDKEKVLNAYLSRMHPTSWSGSLAENMRKKLPLLETLKAHDDETVAALAQAAAVSFSRQVEQEREREEQRDRDRDERFEW